MHLGHQRFWRRSTWPVFFFCLVYFVWFPEWFQAQRAYADGPVNWDEESAPIEWATSGRGIQDQAAALGNHPVLIYEFVRNEVEYEAYSGSRFGAVGTLERRRGNDVDQAMLLAALLRAAWRNLGKAKAPPLWFVAGNVRLTGKQALAWLGVETGEAARNYLTSAGVPHLLTGNPKGEDFELILTNHVWLRGDLEFGPYRGGRFVEGEDGILADLDPSFVVQETTRNVPLPFQLSGINPQEFLAQIVGMAATDTAADSASNLPEGYMLSQADSAAAVFRRIIETEKLTPRQALEQRRPTIETIDALPDALPYALDNSPSTFKLSDATQSGQFLTRTRHRLQIKVEDSVLGNILADATITAVSTYGKTLTIGFELKEGSLTQQELEQTTVANGTWSASHPLRAHIRLDGEDVTTPGADVAYGAPIRLRFAYQQVEFTQTPPPSPMSQPSTPIEIQETIAGSLFSLALVPGLNERSVHTYSQRAIGLAATTAGSELLQNRTPAISAAKALGPTLDLSAQEELFQIENFFQLGASATGHRVSTLGQWAMAGMEPLPYSNGSGSGHQTPRFVYSSSRGLPTLGRVLKEDDPRAVPTSALSAILQLVREAMLVQGPKTSIGAAVEPVSAGRLIRDANSEGLPLYELTSTNANKLTDGADRVPSELGDDLRRNLQASALLGGQQLLPSARAFTEGGGEAAYSLGKLWGYYERDLQKVWSSHAIVPSGPIVSAFSAQMNSSDKRIEPGGLLVGAKGSLYEDLALKSISGIETHQGVAASTAGAFIAAVHPLAALVGNEGSGPSTGPAPFAESLGSAVVFLQAMLDEFSRGEVLSIKLELARPNGSETETRTLLPGEVFNPAYWTTITALGEFNQTMTGIRFYAYDGQNSQRGSLRAEVDPEVANPRVVKWILKGAGAQNPSPLAFASAYNGPLEIRLDGTVVGRTTRQKSVSFVIDTKYPTVSIVPFENGRSYRLPLNVRGTADDLYFGSYEVSLAPGTNPSAGDYRILSNSVEPVAGVGTLANWSAGDESFTGTHTLKLFARDIAGNTSTTLQLVSVNSDGLKPIVAIVPPGTPQNGSVNLSITASDNRAGDTGLSRFRAVMDYSVGRYDKLNPSDPFKTLIISQRSEVLANRNYNTPLASDFVERNPIDTQFYQSHAGADLTLHVTAEDAFGNVYQTDHPIILNNPIIDAYLTNGVIGSSSSRTDLLVFTGDPAAPSAIIDSGTGSALTLTRTTSQTFPNAGASGKTTYLHVFIINNTNPTQNTFTGSNGRHPISVSYGGATRMVDLFVYSNSQPVLASISDPLNTMLFRDKANEGLGQTGKVTIKGWVESPAFEMNNRSDSLPLEHDLPASRPFWKLSYKPHAALPVITASTSSFNFTANYANEANWTEIAHGFSKKERQGSNPVSLATWDLAGLPVGTYDLRLVTTDGVVRGGALFYTTIVSPGYRVINSTSVPGEDPNSNEPGALTLRQVDFSVNFEGFPVEIARSYNSRRAMEKGDFGWGWRLEGISLSQDKTEIVNGELGDLRLETQLSLPDGRTFTYANEPINPVTLSAAHDKNAWYYDEAFLIRPYGQMLWLPGKSTFLPDGLGSVYSKNTQGEGYQKVLGYRQRFPSRYPTAAPDGTIACLKVEDGTYLFYEWETGRLVGTDLGDEVRHVDYSYTDISGTPSNHADDEAVITDNLQRSVRIRRDSQGRVIEAIDPREASARYEYNSAGELSRVINRTGATLEFFYEDIARPHYLTKSIMNPGGGASPVTVNYGYDEGSRLGGISGQNGAGVEFEYAKATSGGGRQDVIDPATGGRSEITYDAAGRLVRKLEASGFYRDYEYRDENEIVDDKLKTPKGALKAQIENGVRTEFDYDVTDYANVSGTYHGYDGIAQRFVDFWMNKGSGGVLTNDYIGDSQAQLQPGYLTNSQVQPKAARTASMDVNGQPVWNTMTAKVQGEGTALPPGDAKITQIRNPEGRVLGFDYGTQAESKNQIQKISGISGVEISHENYSSGTEKGRRHFTYTRSNGDLLKTVTHTYTRQTLGSFSDLSSILTTAASAAEISLSSVWNNYASAWVEKQTSTTVANGKTEVEVAYSDGLESTIAVFTENGEGTEDDEWSVTLRDAEGRTVLNWNSTGAWIRTSFNGLGNPVTVVRNTPDDPNTTEIDEANLSTTTYLYDGNARPIQTLQDGVVQSATNFEILGGRQHITSTDAEGNQSITEQDSAGRSVRTKLVGADGTVRETVSSYAADGRLSYIRGADGAETHFAYDPLGRPAQSVTSVGGRTFTERRGFDRHNRVVWTQSDAQAAATGAGFSSGRYTTTLYATDLTGSADTDSDTDTSRTDDDVTSPEDARYGRVVAVYYEDSNKDAADNDSGYAGYYEKSEYDDQGNQTAIIHPAYLDPGHPAQTVRTTITYNSHGQALQYVLNDVASVSSLASEDVTFSFEYDDQRDRSAAIYPGDLRKEWNRTYAPETKDVLDLVETQVGGDTFEETHYIPPGLVDYRLIPGGGRTDYVYENGQFTHQVFSLNGQALFNHRYNRSEDGRSREVRTFAGSGTSQLLRAESRVENPGLRQLSVSKPEGSLEYGFHESGKLSWMAYLGHRVDYEYDIAGRLNRMAGPEGEWTYRYDAAGNPLEITKPGGLRETRQYDHLGRLKRISLLKPQDVVAFQADYILGVDGRRVGVVELRGGQTSTVQYKYDALGRLLEEIRAAGDQYDENAGTFLSGMTSQATRDVSYTYDAAGNRITETDHLTNKPLTYVYYSNSQRLEKITELVGGQPVPVQTFTWDAAGRLVERKQYQSGALSETRTHSWGVDGTLSAVVFTGGWNDGLRIEYTYDASGTLVARKVLRPSTNQVLSHERYLVDGMNLGGTSQVVAVVDGQTGNAVRMATIGLEFESETDAQTGSRSYAIADALGSTRGRFDEAGQASGSADYAAFGSLLSGGATPAAATPMSRAFAGEQRDPLTSYQNHRARWMDPALGGWLSPDRIFDFPGNFGNERAYASLDPANNTDPFGTFSLSEINVSAAIQSEITSRIGGAMGEAVLKCIFTVAGIDPAMFFEPILSFLADIFNVTPVVRWIQAFISPYLELVRDTLDPILKPIQKIASVVENFMIVYSVLVEAVDFAMDLIKMFMSRSLGNVLDVIVALVDLIIDVVDVVNHFLDGDEDIGEGGGGGIEASASMATGAREATDKSIPASDAYSPSRLAKKPKTKFRSGELAEWTFETMLVAMGFEIDLSLRNKSNNGIDVMFRRKGEDWNPLESKGHMDEGGPKMQSKPDQSKRDDWGPNIIDNMVRGKHNRQEVTAHAQNRAKEIQNQLERNDGHFKKGFIANVEFFEKSPTKGEPRVRLYYWWGSSVDLEPFWDSKNPAHPPLPDLDYFPPEP